MNSASHHNISTVDWVWSMPDFGIPWCTCRPDPVTGKPPHSVNRALIERHLLSVFGPIPDRMSNQDISKVVVSLWKFPRITPPVAEALMSSVKAVNGQMGQDYPTNTAMAVIKHFSNTWHGEPQQDQPAKSES